MDAASAGTETALAAAPGDVPPGLVYVCDDCPGIRRVRCGRHFSYRLPDGRRLQDAGERARIARLAIPPAWTDVWICPRANGHLQATGRDARGRKQYLYHPDWRLARDETKFDRMLAFGAVLPRIRAKVRRDLGQGPGSRQAVLAAVVHLLDATRIRIGNPEYVRSNRSYGLTTLRKRHAAVQGSALSLQFRGKSGVVHRVTLEDRRIARIVRRCQGLPGQDLFQYADADGTLHSVGSGDVNDWLREASGGDFTAKDFRTWHGSVLALQLLRQKLRGQAGTEVPKAKALLAEVAKSLGNTVAVCRKSYVHPRVLALLDCPADTMPCLPPGRRRHGLTAAECALLELLETAVQDTKG